MLTKDEKIDSIHQARRHEQDSGSSAVQVSVLTKRIEKLNEHLKKNHKDKHSTRGLVGLVQKRRKHLNNLKKRNTEEYKSVLQKANLRK